MSFFAGTRSVGPYGWCANPSTSSRVNEAQLRSTSARLKSLSRHSQRRMNSAGPIVVPGFPTGAVSPTSTSASGACCLIRGSAAATSCR